MKYAYVDSSVVVRRYMPGDHGHEEAVALFESPGVATVSSTLTYVEVSGALVRAARKLGVGPADLLARFDEDVRSGKPTLLSSDQAKIEKIAVDIVRSHGIKALDALHIAAAILIRDDITEPGDSFVFYSGDADQGLAAEAAGLERALRSVEPAMPEPALAEAAEVSVADGAPSAMRPPSA